MDVARHGCWSTGEINEFEYTGEMIGSTLSVSGPITTSAVYCDCVVLIVFCRMRQSTFEYFGTGMVYSLDLVSDFEVVLVSVYSHLWSVLTVTLKSTPMLLTPTLHLDFTPKLTDPPTECECVLVLLLSSPVVSERVNLYSLSLGVLLTQVPVSILSPTICTFLVSSLNSFSCTVSPVKSVPGPSTFEHRLSMMPRERHPSAWMLAMVGHEAGSPARLLFSAVGLTPFSKNSHGLMLPGGPVAMVTWQ